MSLIYLSEQDVGGCLPAGADSRWRSDDVAREVYHAGGTPVNSPVFVPTRCCLNYASILFSCDDIVSEPTGLISFVNCVV